MSRNIDLDKSKKVRIRARVNEASVPKVFTFLNSDGTPHDITTYNFKFLVYRSVGSILKLFTLSVGSGLTVQGADSNELLLEITADQATQTPDTYFFRLYSTEEDHTWLNGPFEFHNGEFDSSINETEVIIGGDEGVTIEIISGGSGSTGFAAEHDASGGTFPSGSFMEAQEVKTIVPGLVDGVYCGDGSIFKAMQDNPTSDWNSLTGWRLL